MNLTAAVDGVEIKFTVAEAGVDTVHVAQAFPDVGGVADHMHRPVG